MPDVTGDLVFSLLIYEVQVVDVMRLLSFAPRWSKRQDGHAAIKDGKNLFYRSVVCWLLRGSRCNFCFYFMCCRRGSSESPDRQAEELSVPESIWIGKQRPT